MKKYLVLAILALSVSSAAFAAGEAAPAGKMKKEEMKAAAPAAGEAAKEEAKKEEMKK